MGRAQTRQNFVHFGITLIFLSSNYIKSRVAAFSDAKAEKRRGGKYLSVAQRRSALSAPAKRGENHEGHARAAQSGAGAASPVLSASEQTKLGPASLSVIGHTLSLHSASKTMPSLGSRARRWRPSPRPSPKSLRPSVVCNKSLASPEGSLYVRYNMRSASFTSHVSQARPPLLMNSAT